MNEFLRSKLEARIQDHSLRHLDLKKGRIDFFSNDYLGLAKDSFDDFSNCSGSTGSRLLSGNSIEANDAESSVSSFFESESALIFNSGYAANLGIISCVPQRGDFILYD